MATSIWFWVIFNVFVLGLLVLDLGVFHRHAHTVRVREATLWSVFWITLALLFNAGIWYFAGPRPALQFLTGYLVEKSLSVDNIFVFVLIFSYFRVPAEYQHRVLFWGILGALIMRGLFIAIGALMLERFDWVIYFFGALLLYTAFKMATNHEAPVDPEHSRIATWTRKVLPFTGRYHGSKFWVVENGRRVATPLFLVLVMVEFSDIIFAVDSIPAIFAITRDPFIVYTSNVFAILGLRALYFVLAGVIGRFHLLHYGLAVILGFIGVKMLLADVYHVPVGISLGVIAVVLTATVVLSLRYPKVEPVKAGPPPPTPEGSTVAEKVASDSEGER